MTPIVRGARSTLPSWLALAASLWLSVDALVAWLRHRLPLRILMGHGFTVTVGLLLLAALLAAAALLVCRPGASARGRAPPLRMALYVVVAGGLVHVLWLQPYRSLVAQAVLGVSGGVFAALALAGPRLAGALPRRLLSRADLLAFAGCLLLVGGELVLQGCASVSRSPLFAREYEATVAFMDRYRLKPEAVRPGFPVNASGHFDEDFLPRQPGQSLAVTIGDSFSTSIVPHAWHYTTVAERTLGRGAIHNMGIAAIGLREYGHLLASEALPLDPDVIVIALFVGNDLVESLGEPTAAGPMQRWLDADQLLMVLVPRRLLALVAEGGGDARPAGGPRPQAGAGRAQQQRQELVRLYPWLVDPFQEIPVFSPDAFLRLELRRAEGVCDPDSPPDWPRVFAWLEAMRSTCGETPLALMLIPDVFQVEDALWEQLSQLHEGERLVRDLPQERLTAWCEERGLPCLDLLPVLRGVPPLEDGSRHLYHQRETHFNARGNQAAGEALAGFLAPWWN
jgi:hypothetical protein